MKMKKAINSLYCAYCLALQLFLQHLFLREFTTAQARLGRSLADVNKLVSYCFNGGVLASVKLVECHSFCTSTF